MLSVSNWLREWDVISLYSLGIISPHELAKFDLGSNFIFFAWTCYHRSALQSALSAHNLSGH